MSKPNVRVTIEFNVNGKINRQFAFIDQIFTFFEPPIEEDQQSRKYQFGLFQQTLMMYEFLIKCKFEAQKCQYLPVFDQQYENLEIDCEGNKI